MGSPVTYTIISADPAYDGVTAGVRFVTGVGTTTHAGLADWFSTVGFTVESETPPKKADPEPDPNRKKG